MNTVQPEAKRARKDDPIVEYTNLPTVDAVPVPPAQAPPPAPVAPIALMLVILTKPLPDTPVVVSSDKAAQVAAVVFDVN